jgi:hypothetical protein
VAGGDPRGRAEPAEAAGYQQRLNVIRGADYSTSGMLEPSRVRRKRAQPKAGVKTAASRPLQ